MVKVNDCKIRILCQAKVLLKNKGAFKAFLDKN